MAKKREPLAYFKKVAAKESKKIAAKKRKPGLWFRGLSIEVCAVAKSMRRVCDRCGAIPVDRRLDVGFGSGRHSINAVLCDDCGVIYLEALEFEADGAARYLSGADDPIRQDADDMGKELRRTLRERAKVRKEAREAKKAAQ